MESNIPEETLTLQQQRFCDEYLVSFNAFRSAMLAGYSENTARKGELLHLPKVQDYLKAAMDKTKQRLQITHDMILRELAKIAFANMGNFYDDQGVLKPMYELSDDDKAAISQYQILDAVDDYGYQVGKLSKIKLHNKLSALDKIARHLNFYSVKAAEDGGRKAEDGGQKAEDGVRKNGCGSLIAEDGGRMAEVESLMTEDGVRKVEAGSLTAEFGGANLADRSFNTEVEQDEAEVLRRLAAVLPGEERGCADGEPEVYIDRMGKIAERFAVCDNVNETGPPIGGPADVLKNILTLSPTG
ncbi:terminase small subunit [Mucilaginibacter gracilis]|uniref:Terminase small subunit n=1 Tax=Mucilaginibacter gracilis TaxID=423350 RepID=A0A495IZV8_9SPHI|nr:terminase small subunit [Mucilaginibacter gracilis]RKR81574.1 terminase small subunit [Mucilaginibacter gracilis]